MSHTTHIKRTIALSVLFTVIFHLNPSQVHAASPNTLENLKAEKVKIVLKEGGRVLGYLVKATDSELLIVKDKSEVKNALLYGCQNCLAVEFESTEKIIVKSRKSNLFKIIGTSIAGGLTLLAYGSGGAGDLNPAQFAHVVFAFYGIPSLGAGLIIDELLINQKSQINLFSNDKLNMPLLQSVQFKSPNHNMLLKKIKLLDKVKNTAVEDMHTRKFRFYLAKKETVEGYIISKSDTSLSIGAEYSTTAITRAIDFNDIIFLEKV